jgi:hypothetical protein
LLLYAFPSAFAARYYIISSLFDVRTAAKVAGRRKAALELLRKDRDIMNKIGEAAAMKQGKP